MGDLITRFLITTLVMAAPMLIGAMGTLFIERSGIINIGNEGFMIVNYNDPNENVTANITLELVDCDKIIVYRNGKAVTENVSGGKFAEAIPAGEGVFVIPYKA